MGWVSVLVFVCCDDSTKRNDVDGDATAATSAADTTQSDDSAESPVPADLGEPCSLGGCTFETCVSRPGDCETLCLYDSRVTKFLAYCSLDCADSNPCPAGYECLLPDDAEFLEVDERVCFALPADCGNGIREQGEACDDHNTDEGDHCAADCSAITTPVEPEPELEKTSGRVTLTIDGSTETFEGEVVGGFARLLATGTLEWSQASGAFFYRLDLPDFATRDSIESPQEVRFWRYGPECNERVDVSITLGAFDAASRHVAGSLSATAPDDFCPSFQAELTFDFVWLDRPDLTSPSQPD